MPRILLIEDDARDAARIETLIRRLSPAAVVDTRSHPDEAKVLQADAPFDLAICDVFFPAKGRRRGVTLEQHAVVAEIARAGIPTVIASSNLSVDSLVKLGSKIIIAGLWDKRMGPRALEQLLRVRLLGFEDGKGQSIRWLHISDLHCRAMSDHSREVVERAFLDDIANMRATTGPVDMLLVTGDVADSGRSGEYLLAATFLSEVLEVLELDRKSVFLVPGNHDADRGRRASIAKDVPLVPADRGALERLFDTGPMMEMLTAPFADYAAFAAQFGDVDTSKVERGSWVQCYGAGVVIVGVNSALGTGLVVDNREEAMDKGSLFVDERFVARGLASGSGSKLRIVMMHHPLAYLRDFNSSDIKRALLGCCDVIVHGHLHISEFDRLWGMEADLPVIPCGSLYQGRTRMNSYNVTTIDLVNRTGYVDYRRYSDAQQTFVRDLDSTGDRRNGRFAFRLPAQTDRRRTSREMPICRGVNDT